MITMNRRHRASKFRPRAEALEPRSLLAASGALDTTFGAGSGSTELPFVIAETAHAITALPDGKVVVVGAVTSGFGVARLNPDGSLDPSFGRSGVATITPAGFGTALAVQPDGKILVAGQSPDQHGFFVARLDSDGSLDRSFGQGGTATLLFGSTAQSFAIVNGMAIQPDGKIVLGGTRTGVPDDVSTELAAARLDSDGSLDSSFGADGMVAIPVTVNGRTVDDGGDVAIAPDGKIVISGTAVSVVIPNPVVVGVDQFDPVVIRLDANGSFDASVGSFTQPGRIVLPPVASGLSLGGSLGRPGVAVQPDGKIVLGSGDQTRISATRLNVDGTLDATFGFRGMATNPLNLGLSENLLGETLTIGSDGKIVLAGTESISVPGSVFTQTQETVARFNADGSPDAGFGPASTPGVVVINTQAAFSNINALAIQPDGKILVAGDQATDPSTPYEIRSVYRLDGQATPVLQQPPADFDGSGRTNLSVYLPSQSGFAIEATNGANLSTTFGVSGVGQTIPAPGDYTGAGKSEIAGYLPSYGVYAYRPADGSPDVTVPFGIPGPGQSIPAPGDYEGTGRDDIAVYLPAYATFGIRPATGGPDKLIPFGIPGTGQSIPAPADYFGTGQSDIAVYLASAGAFAIRPPNGGPDVIIPFGLPGLGKTIPVPGDYDGSGHTELAVYIPSFGVFAYRPANGSPDVVIPFGPAGGGGVIPIPGDYDGSGHTEVAIYDPTFGTFAYRPRIGPDFVTIFAYEGQRRTLPAAASPGIYALTIPTPAVAQTSPTRAATPVVSVTRAASLTTGPRTFPARPTRTIVAQTSVDPL